MNNEELYRHERFMKKCIELALIAKGKGESPVGSIIVQNGEIIAEAIEEGKSHKDITYHAEIVAIRQANAFLSTRDLSNCVMYTTHEPCIMCSYVIRHNRIPLIVVGITTGEIGGFSSAYPLLLATAIERWGRPPGIISGILERECAALIGR